MHSSLAHLQVLWHLQQVFLRSFGVSEPACPRGDLQHLLLCPLLLLHIRRLSRIPDTTKLPLSHCHKFGTPFRPLLRRPIPVCKYPHRRCHLWGFPVDTTSRLPQQWPRRQNDKRNLIGALRISHRALAKNRSNLPGKTCNLMQVFCRGKPHFGLVDPALQPRKTTNGLAVL